MHLTLMEEQLTFQKMVLDFTNNARMQVCEGIHHSLHKVIDKEMLQGEAL